MISVVIPAFQAERFVGDAIRSVLAQSYQPIEILVVDDGSTDGTRAVADAFGPPVVVWSKERNGTAAARNDGVARARGELLAFLDADDLWTEDKLALQCAALAADPQLEAVFGHVQQFTETRDGTPPVGEALAGYTPSTMLIRADPFRRVGPFDVNVPRAEAVEWYARARAAGLRHRLLPDVLLRRRIHGDNLGVRERAHQTAEYLKVLRAEIARKRNDRK